MAARKRSAAAPPPVPTQTGEELRQELDEERAAIQAEAQKPEIEMPLRLDVATAAAARDEEAAREVEGFAELGATREFGGVVVSIHRVEIEETYKRLEKDLLPDDARRDYATMFAYADRAEDNAREAYRLAMAARVELARVEQESARLQATMRAEAVRRLEDEKTKGSRTKQITDADVRAKMVEAFPDEISNHEVRLLKAKNAAEFLEEAARIWKIRCQKTIAMLETLRK